MYWNEKPYHSLDYEMKRIYGHKIYKLALDGGMTCPNRDGTLGSNGCIFCSGGGSGEFAESMAAHPSVTEQIEAAKALVEKKMSKAHNNANMLSLGERVLGKGLALEIVEAWLNTEFEGDRHQRRVDLLGDIEKKYNK